MIAVLLQHRKASGHIANIYQDNTCIQTIDLEAVTEPYSFTVSDSDGHENTVTVEPGKICVSEANCPDQICVTTGWISNGTKPIVCLPAKLVIRLETEETDQTIDGVAG